MSEQQSRLSVNISVRTEASLLEVTTREAVSWTEAVRRLVGYGHLVYTAARSGREIVLRGGGQPDEVVTLFDPPVSQGEHGA